MQQSPTPQPHRGRFFTKDFTTEDLILYIFGFALTAFIAVYFSSIQRTNNEDILTDFDKRMIQNLQLKNPPDSLHETTSTNFLKAQLQLVYKRYEFSSRFARTNAYIRFISFLVGTIITILGTMVVIRGVRESPFDIQLSALDKAEIKLKASSPGLILAVAGTLIIITTILKGNEADLNDQGIANPANSPLPAYIIPQSADSTSTNTTK